jgi:hypothetical protein
MKVNVYKYKMDCNYIFNHKKEIPMRKTIKILILLTDQSHQVKQFDHPPMKITIIIIINLINIITIMKVIMIPS